jgi:hypothetical protein
VLRWILQAGQALGDQAAEAWALHQLGTRSLCLGDSGAAQTTLTQALQLRQALGDRAGAAVTQHNLDLLLAAPSTPPDEPPEKPPEKPQPPETRPPMPKWLLPAVGIVAGGGIIAIIGAIIIISQVIQPPTPPPTERPVEATETPTDTPTPSVTPTEAPWISIELENGCDTEYRYGDESLLAAESNTGGPVKIWLDDDFPVGGVELDPGEVWEREWLFTDLAPGEHQFTAVLMSPTGSRLHEAICPFTLSTDCIDFEDLSVDRQYIEGDGFASSDVKITVTDGTVRVEDDGHAGGSGTELNLEEGYLEFHFRPLKGLTLRYSQEPLVTPFTELVINDKVWNGDLLDTADGEAVGGVSVSAGDGSFQLDGTINSFIIGGSDLYIDDVCFW